MIIDFRCRETQGVFEGRQSRKLPPDIQNVARRKLRLIDAAERFDDLRNPPGNRLEVLKAEREGQYSIRINDQWRICFRWTGSGASDVEIVDYH